MITILGILLFIVFTGICLSCCEGCFWKDQPARRE
jgi:hypothetical protein